MTVVPRVIVVTVQQVPRDGTARKTHVRRLRTQSSIILVISFLWYFMCVKTRSSEKQKEPRRIVLNSGAGVECVVLHG